MKTILASFLLGICIGTILFFREKYHVQSIIKIGLVSTSYQVEEGNHENYFFDTKDGNSIRITNDFNGKMSLTNENLYYHKKIIYDPVNPMEFIVLPYKNNAIIYFFWLPIGFLIVVAIGKKFLIKMQVLTSNKNS